MRAAKTAQVWQWPAPRRETPPDQTAQRRRPQVQPVIGLAFLFLTGYLGGILVCRSGVPEFGILLADYYMDKQNFTAFGSVFASMAAALFLQASAVTLCGTSAVGAAPLALLFASKGLLTGAAAASVYAAGGARGLVVYWLLTCLPDIAVLLLLLWLSQAAYGLSRALFQIMLGGGTVRGALKVKAKMLLYRYLLTLVVGVGCGVLGAGAAVLFAGVLL